MAPCAALLLLLLAPPNPTLTETVAIPLQDGQLHAGQLLGDLLQRVGFDGQRVRQQLDLTIDVKGTLGRLQLNGIAMATDGVVGFELTDDALLMRIDRLALRRRERELRTRFRTLMEQWFPDYAQAAAARYGLRRVSGDGTAAAAAVVLIHGLDEPGDVWNALAPALAAEGFTVYAQTYPNDQPIDDSARFFDQQLRVLRESGVTRIAIVAHSMGGLVSRQMLTDPMLFNGKAQRDGRPRVDRLIMVGTPNGGSPLARFRLGAEMREQLIRAMSGDGLLFGSVFDGAGEAQLDLLPDSELLAALNARPHAQGVTMTTIAGIASPIDDDQIAQLKADWPAFDFERLGGALAELRDGVGDGCVSLASAKLAGVDDHVTVEGNHLNMVMHVLDDGDAMPAAAAVVMARLRGWREGLR